MAGYDQKWLASLTDEIPQKYQISQQKIGELPQINNLVYVVNFRRRLEIMQIVQIFRSIGRHHVKFPQNRMMFVQNCDTSLAPIITTLLYDSGCHLISGGHNIESTLRVIQLLRYDMARYGIEVGLESISLVNVVVDANLRAGIDLMALKQQYNVVRWEPHEFPGAMFAMREDTNALEAHVKRSAALDPFAPRNRSVRILAFPNGKLVLTGGKNYAMMLTITERLRQILQPFLLADDKLVRSRNKTKSRVPPRHALASSVRRDYIKAEQTEVKKLHLKPSKSTLRAPSMARKVSEEYAQHRMSGFTPKRPVLYEPPKSAKTNQPHGRKRKPTGDQKRSKRQKETD